MKTNNTAAVSSIRFAGLKNRSAAYTLPTLAAFVAPNGSGKTAITDALQLALTGWHPDFSKTNKGIMELAGGSSLEVEAVLGTGQRLRRSWIMDAKGAVKGTADLPDAWPAEAVALNFNPRAFLRMNAAERANFLLGAAGLSDTPAIVALRDAADDATNGANRCTTNTLDPFAADLRDPVKFCDALEAEAIESRKAHKRDVKRHAETAKGLEDAAKVAEAPVQVEAGEVEAANNEVREAVATVTRLAERHAAARRTLQRAAGLGDAPSHWTAASAEAMEALRGKLVAAEAANTGAMADEARRRQLMASAPEPEEVEEARAALEELATIAEPATSKATLEEIVKAAEADIARTAHDRRTATAKCNEIRAALDGLQHLECCPTCGTAGNAFQANAEAFYRAQLEAVEATFARFDEADTEAAERRDQATAELAKWKRLAGADELRELIKRDAETDRELAAIRERIGTTTVEERNATLRAMRDELRAMEAAKAKHDARLEIGEIPSADEVAAMEAAANEAEAVRKAKGEAYTVIAAKRAAWLQWGTNEATLTRTREELAKAEGKLERCEALVTAARAAKAELAETVTRPLMDGLAVFTTGVLPGEVQVTPDLGIYYNESHRSRCFDALSGSEKAVVAFALAAVFAMRSPLGIAVLDEASTMDATRRPAFLEAVARAVAEGKLTQAIVLDHDPATFAGTAWELVPVAA